MLLFAAPYFSGHATVDFFHIFIVVLSTIDSLQKIVTVVSRYGDVLFFALDFPPLAGGATGQRCNVTLVLTLI